MFFVPLFHDKIELLQLVLLRRLLPFFDKVLRDHDRIPVTEKDIGIVFRAEILRLRVLIDRFGVRFQLLDIDRRLFIDFRLIKLHEIFREAKVVALVGYRGYLIELFQVLSGHFYAERDLLPGDLFFLQLQLRRFGVIA